MTEIKRPGRESSRIAVPVPGRNVNYYQLISFIQHLVLLAVPTNTCNIYESIDSHTIERLRRHRSVCLYLKSVRTSICFISVDHLIYHAYAFLSSRCCCCCWSYQMDFRTCPSNPFIKLDTLLYCSSHYFYQGKVLFIRGIPLI